MTDANTTQNTNATESTETQTEAKTVLNDMQTPRLFATVEDASNYLGACQTDFADFESQNFVLNGVNAEDGSFDPAIYTDDSRVLVHVLKTRTAKRKDAAGNEIETPGAVQAIVVTPVPTIEALLADSQGKAWLETKINTALVKAAMDPLRGADNYAVASKDMPLTLAEFTTQDRTSSSVTETFEKLYKGIMAAFASKSPAWARVMRKKDEFKKSLESAAYALAVYPQLEDRGDKPSYFVMALQFGIIEAKKAGLDPTFFETCLESRDEKAIAEDISTAEDEDFDLSDLALPAPKADAAPAAEGDAPASDSTDGDGPGEQSNEAAGE